MNQLHCKRVYDISEETDGFRILVDRLWPRGIRKEKADIDLWAKEIAPSSELRKWFSHDPEKFEAFSSQYTLELNENPEKDEFLAIVREKLQSGDVTLLYGAKDIRCNHAVVLAAWIESRLYGKGRRR